MRVAYYGPFAQHTGYGQAAHDYMLALHRAGVDLTIRPLIECDTLNLDERYEELIPLALKDLSPSDTDAIIMHTVPRAAPLLMNELRRTCTAIAITTWETTRVSMEMAAALDDAFDCIIVPSEFCSMALDRSESISNKLRVVPHCFDPDHWPVQAAPTSDTPYSFYSILGWSERKNPIGLLKAYLGEFSSDDHVILRLKLSGYSEEDLAALVQATGISVERLPALEIITEHLDHEGMVEFHHSNHCFVTAARGEGWNLPAFEAAVLGKPVITPLFGGQMEFLQEYCNTSTVGYSRTPAIVPPHVEAPVELAGLKVRPVKQTAPSGIDATQHWAEPDLYRLQKQMREHYHRRTGIDLRSRKQFEREYSYETVGRSLADLIERTRTQ